MTRPDAQSLWSGKYKIPWDDPDFSQRMLAEHLTQEHDLASRRTEIIDKQVTFLQGRACGNASCRILDLVCGPGLYSSRLAQLGHQCVGIDFSPASIAYAREQRSPGCQFILGDIRTTDFGAGYDVAMMIYGEFNVFPRQEIQGILAKTRQAVVPGGSVLIEAQSFEGVRTSGLAADVSYDADSGLFSPRPHRVTIENHWYEAEATAQQRFAVTDVATGTVSRYRSTAKAWTEGEILALLEEAGFAEAQLVPEWPTANPDLQLFQAC
jgi:SAM-dependent methyltransferase